MWAQAPKTRVLLPGPFLHTHVYVRMTVGWLPMSLCPLCDAELNLETTNEQMTTEHTTSYHGAAQRFVGSLYSWKPHGPACDVRLPQGGKTLAYKESKEEGLPVGVLKEQLLPALTFPEALSYL